MIVIHYLSLSLIGNVKILRWTEFISPELSATYRVSWVFLQFNIDLNMGFDVTCAT